MADTKFAIDLTKRNCKCHKCKQPIDKGTIRIAKLVPNYFSDNGGEMKQYYHPICLFESFKKARATTKVIEDPGDLQGWDSLSDVDKEPILKLIRAHEEFSASKKKSPTKASKTPQKKKSDSPVSDELQLKATEIKEEAAHVYQGDVKHKDNSFKEFRRLVAKIAETSSYLAKTELVKSFFDKGSDKDKFKGDLHVWVKLLLPGVVKRIYNLQSKQLIKIFSRIFKTKESEMLTDLEQGDVAETIAKFFEDSNNVTPCKKATLTIQNVDQFLQSLAKLTKEDDQFAALFDLTKQCTSNDLKMTIRLIKGDLRMTAGAKHILDALHKDAHEAFNSSRQINTVLDKIVELRETGNPNGTLEVAASLMTPVQPMLAQACKSVDMAFDKCPNGMYSEIKYDGERVQLHKKGSQFKYYSRSLKPVLPHKVSHFKDYIPKAFKDSKDLILDAEVLMVDVNTGNPLPFGSLGIHKAAGFQDAKPCLFIFDCMFYNGENLMQKSIEYRRQKLQEIMTEVGNYVKFSEAKIIKKKSDLEQMIKEVLSQGLEGLVLKDLKSIYEPGKRHWLKVKKDYLHEGAMADSADLVVLGAWYGSGKRGSIMSIFLMGCLDKARSKWKTVTKVHTGHDDETLDRLQKELAPLMDKIKGNVDLLPDFLDCTRSMIPDFIVKNPKNSPVWEITGAEFSKAEIHTADGISIRFPRVTKIRDDKTWESATSLTELNKLFEASKQCTKIDLDQNLKRPPPTSPLSSSQELPSPAKRMKMHDEEISVTLGASGKSFDKIRIKAKSGFHLEVLQGDLFKTDDETTSLAHCVSRDLKMSKGIAKLFRDKFGRVQELERMNVDIGGVAVLKLRSNRGQEQNKFVYNLVTKAKYSDFPTYDNLKQSLLAMKTHALENSVQCLAMPKIGCGLDKLEWNAVRTLIKNIFLDTSIHIKVFTLEKIEVSKKPKQNNKFETNGKCNSTRLHPMLDIAEDILTPILSTNTVEEKELKFQSLPDVFSNDKIFLQSGMENKDLLERYIISFGGEIVPESQISQATIIVRASNVDPKKPLTKSFGVIAKKSVPQVNEAWIYDCITAQKRQQHQNYQ